jgi:hypothetical protein
MVLTATCLCASTSIEQQRALSGHGTAFLRLDPYREMACLASGRIAQLVRCARAPIGLLLHPTLQRAQAQSVHDQLGMTAPHEMPAMPCAPPVPCHEYAWRVVSITLRTPFQGRTTAWTKVSGHWQAPLLGSTHSRNMFPLTPPPPPPHTAHAEGTKR